MPLIDEYQAGLDRGSVIYLTRSVPGSWVVYYQKHDCGIPAPTDPVTSNTVSVVLCITPKDLLAHLRYHHRLSCGHSMLKNHKVSIHFSSQTTSCAPGAPKIGK